MGQDGKDRQSLDTPVVTRTQQDAFRLVLRSDDLREASLLVKQLLVLWGIVIILLVRWLLL
jgi:hypothetical protein